MNATRFLAPVLASLSCIGLLACESGTVRKLPPIPPATELETFFQEREDAVDILLVVDNSCSMEDEQNELANNFEAFVQFIEQVETDYHIGVVTTDVDGDPFDWFGVPGALEGEPHFITSETPDAATVFRNAVRVGTGGSGFERGFEAARLALSPQLLEEENEGLRFRQENRAGPPGARLGFPQQRTTKVER